MTEEKPQKWYVSNNQIALIGRGESQLANGQVVRHDSQMTNNESDEEVDADAPFEDPNWQTNGSVDHNVTDDQVAKPVKDVEQPIDEAAEEEKIQSLKPSVGMCPKIKLAVWEPENERQWEAIGKRIATRNLLASIPNLTCGFGIWLVWSVLASKIQLMHDEDPNVYPFSDWGSPQGKDYKVLLYTLPAVAGLSGGTLRIPNSFMTQVSGGRNVVFNTSLLLCLPMLIVALGMSSSDCPFNLLVVAALLSGVGGGAFASSMSNISFYYPKSQQGYALGMNGGIGNLGVSISQLLAPIFMSTSFGILSPVSPAGVSGWPSNAGWLWAPLAFISAVLAYFWMSNQPNHGEKSNLTSYFYFYWMEILGIAVSFCGVIVLILTRDSDFIKTPAGAIGQKFLLVLLVCVLEHVIMYFVTPAKAKVRVKKQIVIFKRKHTYVMTWLYIMCFGSFIGYSGSFPKLITDLFGYVKGCELDGSFTIGGSQSACEADGGVWDDSRTNPNAPNVFAYAWLGAAVGSLIRPVGGALSDKFGGAKVTMVAIIWCTAAAFAQGFLLNRTRQLDRPEANFGWFVFIQLNLFLCTGAMNGSTFRTIGVLFPPEESGPVLGWSSAIASYGAFIIPAMFGIAISAGAPEITFYGLGSYYITCAILNFWYYIRPGCEKPGV